MNKFAIKPTLTTLSFAIGMLVTSSLLTGCNNADASNNTDKTPEIVAIPVEAAKLSLGSISSQYTTTTVLEAKVETDIISKAGGIIQQIYVEEGDLVKAGDVLAEIDPERLQLNLSKATAELASIKLELDRVSKMFQQKLISTDAFDKLKWQYEAAKATLALAELDLKESKITSPISGYVAKRYVKEGNLVERHQAKHLFHIISHDVLEGTLNLPEQELSKLKLAQQASLNLTALPNIQPLATVKRISPVIDSATGTFRVTLAIDNSEQKLKPGMFAEVKLNYDTHNNVILLPRRSLIAMDNKYSVYTISEDNKASKVALTLGYQNQDFVEIIDGLNGSETVVITGQNNIKEQSLVEVIEAL